MGLQHRKSGVRGVWSINGISFGQGRHGHQKDNQFLNSTIMPALFIYHSIILPINLNREMIPSRFHLIRVYWACFWGLSRPCSDAQAKATNTTLYFYIHRSTTLCWISSWAWARRLQRDSAYRDIIIESHDYRALNGHARHPLIPLQSPRLIYTNISELHNSDTNARLNWVTHIPLRAWNIFIPMQSLPLDHDPAICVAKLCRYLSIYDV